MDAGALGLGAALLALPAATFVAARAAWALGFEIGALTLGLGASLWFLVVAWICRDTFPDRPRRATIVIAATAAALLAGSALLSSRVYDISSDGQAYHQEAILAMVDGWNPEHAAAPPASRMTIFVDHYPQGPWSYAAVLATVARYIEAAKAWNLVLACAAGALTVAAAIRVAGLPSDLALAIGALIALQPVASAQLFVFFVDGQLASLLAALVALLALAIATPAPTVFASIGMALILLLNVKFTAVGYAGILCAGAVGAAAVRSGRGPAIRLAAVCGSATFAGLIVLGHAPYVHNAHAHGHPFYPVMGDGAVEIMSYNRPADFNDSGRVALLARSVFSKTANPLPPGTSELKIPGSVSRDELDAYFVSDVRVGGLGPLFGLATILAGIAGIAIIAMRTPGAAWAAGGAGFIAASALINPEAWWARYAPQIWLVPIVLIVPGLRSRGASLWLAGACLGILGLNAAIVTAACARMTVTSTYRLQRQLQAIAATETPVFAWFGTCGSNRLRLERAGIRVIEVASKDDVRWPMRLNSSPDTLLSIDYGPPPASGSDPAGRRAVIPGGPRRD
jgi:hypothetical protein